MIETHPFGNFVPAGARYLILGSFAGRQAARGAGAYDDAYDWFYGTKKNQFWPILEKVYGIELRNRVDKQALFAQLGIAMADIIYQCERNDNNNLDSNLINIVYNKEAIEEILDGNPIKKIFFTSRFVEKRFRVIFQDLIRHHPKVELICLPSPSPRYARMKLEEKIRNYKELLPKV